MSPLSITNEILKRKRKKKKKQRSTSVRSPLKERDSFSAAHQGLVHGLHGKKCFKSSPKCVADPHIFVSQLLFIKQKKNLHFE